MTTMNTIAQVNHAQSIPTAAVDMDHVALDLSIGKQFFRASVLSAVEVSILIARSYIL